jgi:hypothetical protein
LIWRQFDEIDGIVPLVFGVIVGVNDAQLDAALSDS